MSVRAKRAAKALAELTHTIDDLEKEGQDPTPFDWDELSTEERKKFEAVGRAACKFWDAVNGRES